MSPILLLAILLSFTDETRGLISLELYDDGQICCDDIGCFYDEPKYFGLPAPQCPAAMNVIMTLYTLKNPTNGETITGKTIPSSFNGDVMTIFIVHGWFENGNFDWMHEMANSFLAQGDYNVILVGWRGGSVNLNYFQSAANTRTVGAAIAFVANNTINNGKSSRDKLYCVGHSLGGQVCGHAGRRLKFGRITGLDPAGPWFEESDPSASLSTSCADLVDVIHTWACVIGGMIRPVGHIDFYPNGGVNQPGCLTTDAIQKLTDIQKINLLNFDTEVPTEILIIGCSHGRAYQYYTVSIQTPCFLARSKCESPPLLGLLDLLGIPLTCSKTNDVQSMGFHANEHSGRGIYYLTTTSTPKYCLN